MAKHTIKVLGISGDITTCDCCGKQNLKRTVCVCDLEEEVIRFLGTTCASNAINARNGDCYNPSEKVIRNAESTPSTFKSLVKLEANKRLVAA